MPFIAKLLMHHVRKWRLGLVAQIAKQSCARLRNPETRLSFDLLFIGCQQAVAKVNQTDHVSGLLT